MLLNLISNGFYAAIKRKAQRGRRLRADAGALPTQEPRRRGRDQDPRQRHRHSARGEGEDVQSVLHHQAGGRRDRARPVAQPRHRRETACRARSRSTRSPASSPSSGSCCRAGRHRSARRESGHEAAHPGGRRRAGRRGRCFASSSAATCAPGASRWSSRCPRRRRWSAIDDARDVTLILILSDINMPGMSGLELLPKAKRARPDVPVIMITAYGDADTKRKALENGAPRHF